VGGEHRSLVGGKNSIRYWDWRYCPYMGATDLMKQTDLDPPPGDKIISRQSAVNLATRLTGDWVGVRRAIVAAVPGQWMLAAAVSSGWSSGGQPIRGRRRPPDTRAAKLPPAAPVSNPSSALAVRACCKRSSDVALARRHWLALGARPERQWRCKMIPRVDGKNSRRETRRRLLKIPPSSAKWSQCRLRACAAGSGAKRGTLAQGSGGRVTSPGACLNFTTCATRPLTPSPPLTDSPP
jgi:hypothetical protein